MFKQAVMKLGFYLFFLIGCWTTIAWAEPTMSWPEWIKQLRQDALQQGIRPEIFDEAFANVNAPQAKVLHFDKTQPEHRIEFYQYRRSRIDPLRIKMGQIQYQRYHSLLQRIENEYGVDSCAITAIWGIETSYGNYLGRFPVVQALATLAYDQRRGDYFRNELLIALHILNEGHVSLTKFRGEWAGGSGQPQFMPSSWQKYAVDYNHDGQKDIWTSYDDAFASIANYLAVKGWAKQEPWAIEVRLPAHFNRDSLGLKQTKTVQQWLNLGVVPVQAINPTWYDREVSLVQPLGGPTFMAFNNFKVIMQYNNSVFYAGSVGYLADHICHRE